MRKLLELGKNTRDIFDTKLLMKICSTSSRKNSSGKTPGLPAL